MNNQKDRRTEKKQA